MRPSNGRGPGEKAPNGRHLAQGIVGRHGVGRPPIPPGLGAYVRLNAQSGVKATALGSRAAQRDLPPAALVGAIVVAAGSSRRMAGVDKIFAEIGNRPLIAYTIQAFVRCRSIGRIVLVLHADNLDRGRRLLRTEGWQDRVGLCAGGERRQDSVAAGLAELDGCEWAVIHDGARPMVTGDLIERGLESAKDGAATAGVPVKETIKCVSPDGYVEQTPDRGRLWVAQTPQIFKLPLIREAHERVAGEVTDDASMVERLGYPVRVFFGAFDNFKVTTPEDLVLAEFLLPTAALRH